MNDKIHGGARQVGKTITHGDEIDRLQDIILKKTKLTTKVIGQRDAMQQIMARVHKAMKNNDIYAGMWLNYPLKPAITPKAMVQAYLDDIEEGIVPQTGGGCSVCGHIPAVNTGDNLWLCGGCVRERNDIQRLIEQPTPEIWDAMSNRLRLLSQRHLYSEEIVKSIHESLIKAAYKAR